MPHLRFRAIDQQTVAQLSLQLPKVLAQVMATSEDNFTFEQVHTTFYSQGQQIQSYPFVEVWWFERTQEVQDLAAQMITDQIKEMFQCEDVVVVFHGIGKDKYYENGHHF